MQCVIWGRKVMEIMEVSARKRVVEAPTAILALAIYGLWAAATFCYASIPLWVLAPLGAWTIAWHMSLQHEIIHGHPTRSKLVNTMIGTWPLVLWVPFEIYRRTHLQHHNDSRLTDPLDDPESYYWMDAEWRGLGRVGRTIATVNSTFLGRLTIGPAWTAWRFWRGLVRQWLSHDPEMGRMLLRHVLEVAVVMVWVVGVCRMPFWTYLLCFVYPGTSLAMVRSFAEHRAAEGEEHRTAVVENAPILSVLFLFNNLHVAHHMRPGLAWHRLPEFYRLNRDAFLERNGGLKYDGYFDVWRRYWLKPHDETVHPFAKRPT
jgi:fatty acid desaturase